MGFLSKLLGGDDDPTADWPPATGKPAIDFENHAVGPIRLGEPVEKARPLGRPLGGRRFGPGGTLLEYEEFDLEFDKSGALVCAKFDILDKERVTVAGFALSAKTTPLDVKSWIGEPTSDSEEVKLRWLDFERGDATLALEYRDGKLGCVQLYAKGYA
jgi:hypothetical protein